MATTSLSLGSHWEAFIRREVNSGRFGSASEVVRAALRDLEDKSRKQEALRAHLREGLDQADRGEFADSVEAKGVIANAVRRADAKT